MTRRQLPRLGNDNNRFSADFERVLDKSINTIDKAQKRLFMVWAFSVVLGISLMGAIIYAVIQGGLWFSRQ